MIKINLLPPELRGKKVGETIPAGPMAGRLFVAVAILATVIIAGGVVYYYWSKVTEAVLACEEMDQKVTRLQKLYDAQFSKNQEMKKKWDRMKIQEEILNSLMPSNPLLWSEKMNMVSNAIPSGVYVTQLSVEESTDMVETDHSRKMREDYEVKKSQLKKGETLEEPPVVKKPIIKQTLSIKAASTGKDDNERFDKMLQFERALKNYSITNSKGEKRTLMDNFIPEIAIGTAESTTLDGMIVWAFEFKLITKPFGYSASEPAKQ